MGSFEIYKRFNAEIKSLATSMWVAHLLVLTKLKNINQLRDYFEEKFEKPNKISRRHKSKFFYDKLDGEKLRNDGFVNKIEGLHETSSTILGHPLWQILNTVTCSNSGLVSLAKQLPADIQLKLLKSGRGALTCEKVDFARLNNLDGLAAALLLHIWQKQNNDTYNSYYTDKAVLKLLLRLFSFSYKKFNYPYETLQLISQFFNQSRSSQCIDAVKFRNFPVFLGEIKNRSQFELCCRCYRDFAKNLITADGLENDENIMMDYMRFVNHDDFEQLTKDIRVCKGVFPEETDTALGELRLLYYSNKKLIPPLINFFTPEQIKQKIAMNFEKSIFGIFN